MVLINLDLVGKLADQQCSLGQHYLHQTELGDRSESACAPWSFKLCISLCYLPRKKVFHGNDSFVAVPHSVAWKICWTLNRHMCSLHWQVWNWGDMFSLSFSPVRSLKSVSCQTQLSFPKGCASEKSFLESPVLINLAGNNYKVWLAFWWIGFLMVKA